MQMDKTLHKKMNSLLKQMFISIDMIIRRKSFHRQQILRVF